MSSGARSSYDVIVIGSGPAGQRAAMQSSKAGKKAVIIEAFEQIGGGCVHTGTLPSKSFRESVYRWSLGSRGTLGREAEHARVPTGGSGLPDIDRLLKRRDRVVEGEVKVIGDQLRRNKITVLRGHARFVGPHDVEVTGAKGTEIVTAPFIVIAVGATPVSPAHLEVDGKIVHDSNTILGMKKVPKSLVVLGAGIIGCEYASMFSTAGTKVYLVDRRKEILASVDREIVNHLIDRYTHMGMELVLSCEATEIERKLAKGAAGRHKAKLQLSIGREIEAESVLIAQGRFGNTTELALEKAGLKADDRGLLKVDKHFRTAVPHIYAVGDVVGAPALASTSMEQGRIAVCDAFKIEQTEMSPYFPYGIYTIPEISMVGKTEEDLVAEKVDFVAGKARYRELARGQIVGDQTGLLKLMVDRRTLKILGVHIIGDNAADLVHIGQAVMAFGGDATYFIKNVFNYPTLAEAYKTAAFHAVNQIKGVTTTR